MVNCIFMAILLLIKNDLAVGYTVYNPYFHFPGGSDPFMGMIVTVAVPVEAGTPGEVLLSTILEGNYVMPDNQTEFEYPPIYPAEEERTFLYDILKRKIEDFGYSGKYCLLRAICETAHIPIQNTGILGDIVHVLLTPSSSKLEKELDEYRKAEKQGRKKGCNKYMANCPYSIMDAITTFDKFMTLTENKIKSNKIVKLF